MPDSAQILAAAYERARHEYGEAIGQRREELITPALVLDIDAAQRNIDRMAAELSKVLDHIEAIRELDLEGVPPTSHVIDVVNALRTDEPTRSLPREVILAAAPEPVNDGFGVPSPGAA